EGPGSALSDCFRTTRRSEASEARFGFRSNIDCSSGPNQRCPCNSDGISLAEKSGGSGWWCPNPIRIGAGDDTLAEIATTGTEDLGFLADYQRWSAEGRFFSGSSHWQPMGPEFTSRKIWGPRLFLPRCPSQAEKRSQF